MPRYWHHGKGIMVAALYLIAGLAISAAGLYLIGWQGRRIVGSLTLFVGLNLMLLSYALWQGIGNEAEAPAPPASTAATPDT